MEFLGPWFVVIGIIIFFFWIFDVELRLVRWLRRNPLLVGVFFLLAAGFWLLLAGWASMRDLGSLSQELTIAGDPIRSGAVLSRADFEESFDRLDRVATRLEGSVERLDDVATCLEGSVERLDDVAVRLERTVERIDDAVSEVERASDSLATIVERLAVAPRSEGSPAGVAE